MIDHSFEDVASQLTELKRSLVASMADEQRLYQRYAEASGETDRWRRRAELALRRGAEELARGALARSNEHHSRAQQFYAQYLEQKTHVERMKARLLELESRARGLPPAPSRPPDIARVGEGLARLERWEQRAERERARLLAWAEMERDELAEKLEALEREELLERQLQELKARQQRGEA